VTTFFQLVVVGISTGSVFAIVGMSLVLVYRATGIVNFAQGVFAVLGGLLTYSIGKHMSLPLAAVLVVTGAFVTAAGPHSGGEDIERLGDLEDAMWVHVRVSAVFGIAFLVLVAALQRFRERARGTALLAGGVLALLLVQMVVGEVQWRNQLPWELVLGHVTLATLVWTGVAALAVVLRPPRDA